MSSLASTMAGLFPCVSPRFSDMSIHQILSEISRDASKHVSSEQVGHKPAAVQGSYLPLCPRCWVAPGPALLKFGST